MGEVEVCIDDTSPTSVPLGNCMRSELKRDRVCIEVGSETRPLPAKKLVVEASSREDGRSEVSNPVVSPKEANSAFQDITSHPGHVRRTDQGGFTDETSKISYQSGSVETMCDEEIVGNCTESSGKGLTTPVEILGCSASRDMLNHHEDNAGSYAESSDSGSPGSAKVSTSTDSEQTLSNGEFGGNYTGSTCKSISGSQKGYSGLEETLSNEDNAGNYAESGGGALPGSVEKSSVVLEIPEHASTTGVRKITFRFSKLKDLDSQPAPNSTSSNVGYHKFEAGREQDNLASVGTSLEHMITYERGDPLINCNPIARNMELKMSKKVVPNGFPTNVKKLLSTGILDGARVKYVHSGLERGLEGIISGGGYLCGCSQCNYLNVVSAYEFELHAGVKTKHPNNHIYLDNNGKPIYHIVQQVKTAPLGLLDEVIRDIAGSAINEDFFQIWKGNLQQSNSKNIAGTINGLGPPKFLQSQPKFVDNMCVERGIPMFNHSVENTVKFMGMPAKKKRAVKKPCSSTYVKQVKRSAESGRKRDNDLHKLLFMPNGLPDGAELAYSIKGQTILGGYKQGGGIVCSCCDKEISPSQFEAHAGMAARRQPYRHIYTSSGLNLHDIATSLANGQSITTGGNDDMCTVCGEGGDLILCIGCPRAFHSACLGMLSRPESDWCCSNCSDKFVPGRKMISGDSISSRPIMIRLTRVVKEPENEIGGCAICRSHDFSVGNFDERTVMICDQCEKEYHVGCMRKAGLCDLTELPKDKWFCCEECNNIHLELQRSVSIGLKNVPAIALDLINSKVMDKELLLDGGLGGVQWQILNGKSRCPEHLPLLSSATGIFRECFDPIVAASGRDLIPLMVYGRNISGQEFGGMYCIVLTVKGVVVSAGLLRVFGKGVAELPLVATAREHQGKGYFQALFSCIKDDLLYKMNVEKIVLPAAEEAELMWTKKFDFRKVSEEQVKKYMREFQLTIFMGTSLLEKEVQQLTIES